MDAKNKQLTGDFIISKKIKNGLAAHRANSKKVVIEEEEEDELFYDLASVSAGAWYCLHVLAADGKHDALESLLETFSRRFVCPDCSIHIEEYLIKRGRPPRTGGGEKAYDWTVDFHNEVNARTTGFKLSDEGRRKLYYELTTDVDKKRLERKNAITNTSSGEQDDRGAGGDCSRCNSNSSRNTQKPKARVGRSFV